MELVFYSSSSVIILPPITSLHVITRNPNNAHFIKHRNKRTIRKRKSSSPVVACVYINSDVTVKKTSRVNSDSLRVLEWDKVCDSVASFAGTCLGREATKNQLWSSLVDHSFSFNDSITLLDQTYAAVKMHNYAAFSSALDFARIDPLLVEHCIARACRSSPLEASEALAVATLLQFVQELQLSLKAAIKEDAEWYDRFMPLSEMINQLVVNPSLIKLILQVIDEDGSVKDTASPLLKRARDQVRVLEAKLYQLMDRLVRKENEANVGYRLEVSNIDGRWCIKSEADQQTSIKGLLLPSGSGMGNVIEPLSAVSLNDELQHARASVAKAESEVLLMLTEKMQMTLDDINLILKCVVQLDAINARATYSLSFGGTRPCIFLPDANDASFSSEASVPNNNSTALDQEREWVLYLPKAYHPLLLQKYRKNLKEAKKDVRNATAEIRRRKLQGGKMTQIGELEKNLSSLKMQVSALEQAPPVPVDFFIARKTRVLVITGPNTGGKTLCLKTIGLAAMMAKSGLYVLASESAQIPWFDSVFADIGDEQSLSQSLSTFSGHLKQISDIRSESSSQSLVLLDEVGAGTNPLEGAALGMSLLESFAESGALLTIATTHHSELKTLKYSKDVFENACMEFDEENLKPTYKILWGVPGRSNAINIAERLGLPSSVIENARELYGAASAEINEVIMDMEQLKQKYQKLLIDSRRYLMLSNNLHENLLLTRRKLTEKSAELRYTKTRKISELAAFARSTLYKKLRQVRASAAQSSQPSTLVANQSSLASTRQRTTSDNGQHTTGNNNRTSSSTQVSKQLQSAKRSKLPENGDTVLVSSLGKKATVLRVEPDKDEITVQAGVMKLKIKLKDVQF